MAQESAPPFEVIVVDSSSDQTPAIIRREFPEVRLIHLPNQTPEGEARNIGIKAARGGFMAMTDQDCIVPADWLARIAQRFQRDRCVAVGGSIIPSQGDGWFARAGFLAEFSGFLPGDKPGFRRSIPTCNIAYSAQAFRDGQGFPTAFPVSEDMVFNWVLSARGGKIFFDPTIVATHQNRQGFKAVWTHMRYLGIGSARARILQPDLPGGHLLKFALVLPSLLFYRWFAVNARLVRTSPANVWKVLLYSIPMLLCLTAWTLGFREGLRPPAAAGREQAQP